MAKETFIKMRPEIIKRAKELL